MVKFTFKNLRRYDVKKTILSFISVIGIVGVFSYPNGSLAKESNVDKVDLKQLDVGSHKKWTLEFTDGIVESNLTKDNVYVTDEQKELIPISFAKLDEKTVQIYAPKQGYDKRYTYTLHVNKNLDKTNSPYKKDIKSKEYSIQFTVK